MIDYKDYFKSEEINSEYVGFIDILGFSNTVSNNFQEATNKYNEFINNVKLFGDFNSNALRIRVLSDSIILTSQNFSDVVVGTNLLLHGTLAANFLTRGGIASGKHIDVIDDDNYYMVSEALVKAVQLEKCVKSPCVVLHEELYPSDLNTQELPENRFLWKLLYFDDLWIVNPFNIMWGTSAATRVKQLKQEYPQHSEKYDWFLNLYEAVANGEPLIPKV